MSVSYSGTIPAPWIARGVFEFDPTALGVRLIADQIARPIQSDDKQGVLPIIKREFTMPTDAANIRAPGATYDRGHVEVEGGAFACIGYGYEQKIPVETQALYASVMDSELVAGRAVKGQLLTRREIRIKDLLFDTAVWTGAALVTDVTGDWDAAASDVIGHVGAAKEKVRRGTGLEANALILGTAQLTNLLYVNTAIGARLVNVMVDTPAARLKLLASILGLDYVFAGGGVYNAANEAAAISVTDIWGDDYAMVAKVAVTDDPSEPCVARIINWRAMGPGTDVEFGVYFESQSKSRIVQGDLYEDEIVVDAYCGHLLSIDT